MQRIWHGLDSGQKRAEFIFTHAHRHVGFVYMVAEAFSTHGSLKGELLALSLVQSKWKLNLQEVWIIFLSLPHVFPALADVQYSTPSARRCHRPVPV